LGGIGKTQLAIEYAWRAIDQEEYDYVFWIRASSIQSIDADLASLAAPEMLNLPEAAASEEAIAMEAVLRWCKTTTSRWLLIADNADTDDVIRSLRDRLPVSSTGHIIVTSRVEAWPGFTSIVLDTLAPQMAIQMLKDCVKRDQQQHMAGSDADAEALVCELGFLPLAIEQAAGVIASRRWTFKHYLDVFRSEGARLRSDHNMDDRRYPASIATTWLVSLDKLTLRAHAILQLSSWLRADEIPRILFADGADILNKAFKENGGFTRLQVEDAFSELGRLSLIRLTTESFSVHRLLQAVEQDQLADAHLRRGSLLAAALIVQRFAPSRPANFKHWDKWVVIRPHVEEILKAASTNFLDPAMVCTLASRLAIFLHSRADFEQAVKFGRQAVHAASELSDPDLGALASAESNLGAILESMNQLEEAAEVLHHSVESIESQLDIPKYDRASAFNNYANVLRSLDRLDEAERYYRKAVAIIRTAPVEDQAFLTGTLGNLGLLLKTRAKFKESEETLREAVELSESQKGPDHPDVARALNDLGFLYRDLKRYNEAEPLLVRALKIAEKVFGSDHQHVAATLDNLGSLMRLTGRREIAEAMLRRACKIIEVQNGPEHPKLAISLVNLAVLLLETDRPGEAERLFRRALKIDEGGLGPDHHEVANDLDRLATLLVSVGRLREAETLAKRALRIYEERLSHAHPDTLRVRETLESLRRHRRGR
jgi:tetratricopeptide (TPR) repeat protein